MFYWSFFKDHAGKVCVCEGVGMKTMGGGKPGGGKPR